MSFAKQVANFIWEEQGLSPEETMFRFTREEFEIFLVEKLKPMTVKLHTCMIDSGDGSAYPAIFKTAQGAERREEFEVNEMGQGFCSATGTIVVGINASGQLVEGNDYTHFDTDEEYNTTEYFED